MSGTERNQNILAEPRSSGFAEVNSAPLSLLCPHCGHQGAFIQVGNKSVGTAFHLGSRSQHAHLAIRQCPNTACHKVVFTVSHNSKTIAVFPPTRLPVKTDNVPPQIANSIIEAVDCYAAGAFRGAALMVRRTLEEICDERGAKGDNLKKRLEDLSAKIVIPTALTEAMDELRLLGNDAAHIEARVYNDVGEEEVLVAIDLTAEILKAAYQLDKLVERLRKLKKE